MRSTAIFVLLVIALALAVVVLVALARLDRRLPQVASILSRVTIAGAGLWLIVHSITLFAGGPVTVTAPITQFPIHLADGVDLTGPTATIHSGGFDRVTVEANGLSISTTVILLLTAVAGALTLIGVCLIVDRLARSLSDGDPFVLGGEALQRAGWVVLAGGVASEVLGDVGNWRASHDLFWIDGWSATGDFGDISDITDFGWPHAAGLEVTLPFWPIGASVVLALLAAVFRYGAHLRRETTGLI